MNKTDFAELKEELTTFDEVGSAFSFEQIFKNIVENNKDYKPPSSAVILNAWFRQGKLNHKLQTSPIITELLEIVSLQNEKLIELNEFTSSVLEDMEHYFDNKCVPTIDEVNQCAIADSLLRVTIGQTNTRLQKLREGKNG